MIANSAIIPKKILVLDLLRGIAALWVCWYHACILFFPSQKEPWWAICGYLGVPVFFVISGFVIPYSLASSQYTYRDFGLFIAKRLLRLHPPYIVSILAVLCIGFVANLLVRGAHYHYGFQQIITNALLIAPWMGYSWLLKAYWSLAVELQWYIAAALLFPIYSAKKVSLSTIIIVGLSLIGSFSPIDIKKEYILQYLPLFAMGMLAFRFHIQGISSRLLFALMALLCITCYYRLGLLHSIAGVITLICILYVKKGIPLLDFLGKISYSLYLIHGIILMHCLLSFPKIFKNNYLGDHISRMMVGILLSILSASILYYFIEKPSQKLSQLVKYNRS